MNEFKGNDQDTKDVITLKDMKGSVDDFMAECKDQELSSNTLIKYERGPKKGNAEIHKRSWDRVRISHSFNA